MIFHSLDDYLLPFPLPALLAVGMVLGIGALGRALAATVLHRTPDLLETTTAALVIAALLAALVHTLAWVGWASTVVLRPLAWIIALIGCAAAARSGTWLTALGKDLQRSFIDADRVSRAALILNVVILVGLALGALGPPTDADSQDYSLAAPLDILRMARFVRYPGWFHYRLIGLGEMLNLLGLAGGTDTLGAALQWASLAALVVLASSLARHQRHVHIIGLTVLSTPVVVFLTLNQKPQLIGTLALFASLVLALRIVSSTARPLVLSTVGAWLCLMFGVSVKLSFLLPGVPIAMLLLYAGFRTGTWRTAALSSLAAYLGILLPLHLRNYLSYGDPIWPMLSGVFSAGTPAALEFRESLRNVTPGGRAFFPLNLFITLEVGNVTHVLGLSLLLALFVVRPGLLSKMLFAMAAIAATLSTIFAQHAGRFFLDPLIWTLAGAGACEWRPALRYIVVCVVAQGGAVAATALYGAAILFPGALSGSRREAVRLRYADDYAAYAWLSQHVPLKAVIVADLRSKLAPRPLIPVDDIAPANPRSMAARILDSGAEYYLASYPTPWWPIGPSCIGRRIAGPQSFSVGVRNPRNRGTPYQMAIYRLNRASCGLLSRSGSQAP